MQSVNFNIKENILQSLLHVARECIKVNLQEGRTSQVTVSDDADPDLLQHRGCFVSLKVLQTGRLRGCIGSLSATEPLVNNVVANAQKAAFSDARFVPVTEEELPKIGIEISVLGDLHLMQTPSREALLQQLQPRLDGLVLVDGNHQGTFLPDVWNELQTPEEFVSQLFLKAGLPPNHWSQSMQCYQYRTVNAKDSMQPQAPTLNISI